MGVHPERWPRPSDGIRVAGLDTPRPHPARERSREQTGRRQYLLPGPGDPDFPSRSFSLRNLGAVTLVGEHGRPWKTELAWVHPPDGHVHTASLRASEAPEDELRAAVERVLAGGSLMMLSGVAVFGLATCVFAVSRSLWLSVAALAVLGGADMLSVYIRQTLIQLVTPDPMRGRVAAVASGFIGASNELGEFESGVVARLLTPVGAALFGGIGALVVTGLWAWLFPALRKADRLE